MKKFLIGLASAAAGLALFAAPAFAVAATWNITAPRSIDFVCGGGTYNHTLLTVSEDPSTGYFTGTGQYDPDHSYTWNITGNTTSNNLTFTIVYTGSNAGYTLHGVGTIASDGSISGTTDGNCQTFTMPVGTAVFIGLPTNKDQCKKDGWKTFGIFKNQGDCVSFVATGGKNPPANQETFTAIDSLYYNCPVACQSVYGTGSISFTWDPNTGNVTGGYYNEIVPPTTGTVYNNLITGGSVSGGNVSLTFNRTVPNVYGPFYFTGTLVGKVLTGQLDGPYYFTATGN